MGGEVGWGEWVGGEVSKGGRNRHRGGGRWGGGGKEFGERVEKKGQEIWGRWGGIERS